MAKKHIQASPKRGNPPRIRFTRKEVITLVIAVALALGTLPTEYPRVAYPMLGISWLALMYLCFARIGEWYWRTLSASVVTILLVLIALYSYVTYGFKESRLTIEPSNPVDLINPFSASFTITNIGSVALDAVAPRMSIGQIKIGGGPEQYYPQYPVNPHGYSLASPSWGGHRLESDEKFTITIEDMIHVQDPIAGADIAFVVTYEPTCFSFKKEQVFRFATHKQTDGHLYWYSYPIR